MSKLFIYEVMGYEFDDTEAFGKAWKEAKAKATELHCPIYRTVVRGEELESEVFYQAGVFNSVRFATAENVKIF